MKNNVIHLSSLSHTWIFDIDGTLVKHNGYKDDGYDTLLPSVKDFFFKIPHDDFIILITSRSKSLKEKTERFLSEQQIRFNYIIYDAPYGERILVNDRKPSGMETCISCPVERNDFNVQFCIDTAK